MRLLCPKVSTGSTGWGKPESSSEVRASSKASVDPHLVIPYENMILAPNG